MSVHVHVRGVRANSLLLLDGYLCLLTYVIIPERNSGPPTLCMILRAYLVYIAIAWFVVLFCMPSVGQAEQMMIDW